MNPEKTKILSQVIECIEAEARRLNEGLEHMRHAKREAPGRMESRYDTMGIESSWVADGLARTLNDRTETLQALRTVQIPMQMTRVAIGALVGVGSAQRQVDEYYFILPGAAGISCTLPETQVQVMVISPSTPIARQLLGKAIGDVVASPGKDSVSREVTFLA